MRKDTSNTDIKKDVKKVNNEIKRIENVIKNLYELKQKSIEDDKLQKTISKLFIEKYVKSFNEKFDKNKEIETYIILRDTKIFIENDDINTVKKQFNKLLKQFDIKEEEEINIIAVLTTLCLKFETNKIFITKFKKFVLESFKSVYDHRFSEDKESFMYDIFVDIEDNILINNDDKYEEFLNIDEIKK